MKKTQFSKNYAFFIVLLCIGSGVSLNIIDDNVSTISKDDFFNSNSNIPLKDIIFKKAEPKPTNKEMEADIFVDDDADPEWYDETHVHTIQEGVDNASVQDIIFVYNGVYAGNIYINKTVSLLGENKELTKISGGKHNIWVLADYALIKNFNITGSPRYFSAIYTISYGTNICDNNFNNNYDGIYIDGAANITISRNIFTNNYNRNLRLEFASDCLITNNYIGGAGVGIYLWASSQNIIRKNTIDNCDWGLSLGDFSEQNSCYHNNLISNDLGNAVDDTEGNNIWDNGYPSGGNFWDDYEGVDEDDDNIGDTSYVISNEAVDRFPLINPVNMTMPDIMVSNGFGLNIELINNEKNQLNGLIRIAVKKKDNENFEAFEKTIIDLDPGEEEVISKKIFGFGRGKISIQYGIWKWEQNGFLIGPWWVNTL